MAFNAWADLLLAFGNRFEIPLSLTELYSHTAKAILGEQLYALQRAVAGRRQPKELQSTEVGCPCCALQLLCIFGISGTEHRNMAPRQRASLSREIGLDTQSCMVLALATAHKRQY